MKIFKIFKPFLIMIGLILLFPTSARADNFDAKIIDLKPPLVSIALQGNQSFNEGENVELSYMAGLMEILIGRYEITHIQNNVLTVRSISSAFYPPKDMQVMITKVGGNTRRPDDMGPDPSAFDPAEMNFQLPEPPSNVSPAQDSSQQMDSRSQPW
ncbi:MAG: hypothetical protein JW902_10630 [Syntrophaceae bacterium]|nr:hypothetical protein [Syntrophaceae bacterium]